MKDQNKKLSQMIMLGLDTKEITDEILTLISNYHIGGVVLYKDLYQDIPSLIKVVNQLKKANGSNPPLFIALDQENGRVNRLPKDILRIYSASKQAKTKNLHIIDQCNLLTANILSQIGINMNLAPVVDINYSMKNKAIGDRSYGDNCLSIIKYALPMIKTFKDRGIISVIKHFPGHSYTKVDSHFYLPKITDLDKMEKDLCIYSEAFKQSCPAIMVGHLRLLGYGQKPATMNKLILDQYLFNKYNYRGLVLTDDLKMNVLKSLYGIKKVILNSISSGANLLIIKYQKGDTKRIYDKLYLMLEHGQIDINKVNQSYHKIIDLKKEYNLSNKLITNNLNIDEINQEIQKVNHQIDEILN